VAVKSLDAERNLFGLGFGAEVAGIQYSAVDVEHMAALASFVMACKVVVLRDQKIDVFAFRAFFARWPTKFSTKKRAEISEPSMTCHI
jgi:alpha-ketoglutarate-dependent taurine dioxygenase